MADFVRLLARSEDPLRTVEMIAPVEYAEEKLWALALELPRDMVWEAVPVDDIGLRSESQATP